jgi:hypothetical protein
LIECIWQSQKFDKLSFAQKCTKIHIADKAGSVSHLISTLKDIEQGPIRNPMAGKAWWKNMSNKVSSYSTTFD